MSKDLKTNKVFNEVRKFITEDGLVDAGETKYFDNQLRRYKFLFERLIDNNSNEKKLLDVGSHLLHFAIAARIIGYQVYGTDVLFHLTMPQTISRQNHFNICVKECDLFLNVIPFSDDSFDIVNFAETLEHLSFNPLPTLKELYRVLKPGGSLLLTTPNVTRLGNRIKLLKGQNIYTSIEEFCADVPYGIHYREYTLNEVENLLNIAGFHISVGKTLYFHLGHGMGRTMRKIMMLFSPSMAGNLFIEARKSDASTIGCSSI